jgi:hypothetical protein
MLLEIHLVTCTNLKLCLKIKLKDHEAEGEAVEGEDPETSDLRPTTQAVKLWR